ncbi:sensor histidine kinase [bacterium]
MGDGRKWGHPCMVTTIIIISGGLLLITVISFVLKLQVGKRTLELATKNKQFEDEIAVRKQAEEDLIEREEQLRYLSQKVILAQEEERKRLARELHDSLGQRIISIQLEIEWLKNRELENADKDKYINIVGLTVDASDELQQICLGLRPLILDRIGFTAAIKALLEEFETNSDVEIDAMIMLVDETRISPDTTMNLYRILQEALTNAVRHSKTKKASVSLREEGSELVLEVKDEGCGLAEDESSRRYSFGILGMRERANMSNGYFEMNSTPGKGTHIRVSVPVDKPIEEPGV